MSTERLSRADDRWVVDPTSKGSVASTLRAVSPSDVEAANIVPGPVGSVMGREGRQGLLHPGLVGVPAEIVQQDVPGQGRSGCPTNEGKRIELIPGLWIQPNVELAACHGGFCRS
jgi:hypothetical protein